MTAAFLDGLPWLWSPSPSKLVVSLFVDSGIAWSFSVGLAGAGAPSIGNGPETTLVQHVGAALLIQCSLQFSKDSSEMSSQPVASL